MLFQNLNNIIIFMEAGGTMDKFKAIIGWLMN